MNLESLEDGAEFGQSLLKHGAKHHKKCYEMFSNAKLEPMEKSDIKSQIGASQLLLLSLYLMLTTKYN